MCGTFWVESWSFKISRWKESSCGWWLLRTVFYNSSILWYEFGCPFGAELMQHRLPWCLRLTAGCISDGGYTTRYCWSDAAWPVFLAYSPEKSLVSMVWLDSDQRIWHHWRKNGSKVRVNRKHLKKKKKHHEQHTSQAKNKVSVPNFCQKQPEDHTKILWRNIRISHCDADVFPTDVSPVVRCAFWRPHSLE